jgi:NADPH-dependent 2,4-dienoyl-CoA reductase/sulfur reductase-like enzyme
MTQNPPPRPDADVIIVGAGPAGMAAAVELADAGCSVIVLDMAASPGGQIYRALEANVADTTQIVDLLAALGPSYMAGLALIRRFRAAASIDYREQTTVWEVRPDGTVGWLRGNEAGYLRGRQVLLANGAMERPTPFPGWTLPGVMTAGAVQTLLKAGRLKPTGRVVLAGTGPLILLLADQMRRLGVKPALVARTDRLSNSMEAARYLCPGALLPLAKGLRWLARLRLANVKLVSGISRLDAQGNTKVETVSYSVGGRRFTIPCDLLVVHDGIVPSVDLALGAGLALEWDSPNASWRPKTAIDGTATVAEYAGIANQSCKIRVTGDARRIGGADAAIVHGKLAASVIIADLNKALSGTIKRAESALKKAIAARPFLDAAFPPGLSADPLNDDTIVCRCEELTAGLLRATLSAGTRDINLLRAETRCGMGPCQGRNCMITVARLVAESGAVPLSVPGSRPAFRARPPARPLPLGALANLTGLDPEASKILTLEDKPHAFEEVDHAEEQ